MVFIEKSITLWDLKETHWIKFRLVGNFVIDTINTSKMIMKFITSILKRSYFTLICLEISFGYIKMTLLIWECYLMQRKLLEWWLSQDQMVTLIFNWKINVFLMLMKPPLKNKILWSLLKQLLKCWRNFLKQDLNKEFSFLQQKKILNWIKSVQWCLNNFVIWKDIIGIRFLKTVIN